MHPGTLACISLMSLNIRDQQSGIHLPPVRRFLLRPNHLAETWPHSIQNELHSDTLNTLAKHTAVSYLHWHANKPTHYKGKTLWQNTFIFNNVSHSLMSFTTKQCTPLHYISITAMPL